MHDEIDCLNLFSFISQFPFVNKIELASIFDQTYKKKHITNQYQYSANITNCNMLKCHIITVCENQRLFPNKT